MYQNGDVVTTFDFDFDIIETTSCLGKRELIAIREYFLNCLNQHKVFSCQMLYWQTDNPVTVHFITKGSRRKDIQAIIYTIKVCERQLNVRLIPVLTASTHYRIELARAGCDISQSTDEWGVPPSILVELFQRFQCDPEIDAFASSVSTICTNFYAKCPQPGAIKVNFFAQDLIQNIPYFLCPPTKLTCATIDKFTQKSDMIGILVVPNWKGANYWPVLHNGKNFHPSIKNVAIFKCKAIVHNNVKSIFSNNLIEFLAVLLKT